MEDSIKKYILVNLIQKNYQCIIKMDRKGESHEKISDTHRRTLPASHRLRPGGPGGEPGCRSGLGCRPDRRHTQQLFHDRPRRQQR